LRNLPEGLWFFELNQNNKKRGEEQSMNALKKAAVATAMLTGFAGAAFAAEENFTACTLDGKTATLTAEVRGGLKGGKSTKEMVAEAFKATAKDLSGEDLVKIGFPLFVNALQAAASTGELTDDAAFGVSKAPTVGGPDCKP
jgi:hypothetical protein